MFCRWRMADRSLRLKSSLPVRAMRPSASRCFETNAPGLRLGHRAAERTSASSRPARDRDEKDRALRAGDQALQERDQDSGVDAPFFDDPHMATRIDRRNQARGVAGAGRRLVPEHRLAVEVVI
jgi:hypothetical protein